MSVTIYSTTLAATSCGSCGVPFGLPLNLLTDLQNTGRWFYCPNGHHIRYHDDENTQLRNQLAREERLRKRAEVQRQAAYDQADAAERSARAVRGHMTRLRNRIANGVCPWCRRSFPDVLAHIGTKHPDHQAQAKEAVRG